MYWLLIQMVSRRKILSQSRDELSYELNTKMEEEDDVWFTKEKLFKVGLFFIFLSLILPLPPS